jgi:inner membrane protein
MDPISQGAVGAAFSQTAASRESLRAYAIFGCLAGMAPDLDVFIQSSTDPLLFLEYHRHFTHALVFIPVGALIVTSVLFRLFRHPLSWQQAYLAAFIGYATHGLLDACTSYGTLLLWPFSDVRVAWNNVSVVDPLLTLPLLGLIISSAISRKRRYAVAAVAWLLTYLGLGMVQHERASDAARQMALAKGHQPYKLAVKPGFGNLILWKTIYQHDGAFYVDAVRVAGDTQVCPGDSAEVYLAARHLPELAGNSQQAKDIERFRWFSQDYLAAWGGPGNIIDVRYAAVPNEITPLWGIHVDTQAPPSAHVKFVPNRRATTAQSEALWNLITGSGCHPLEGPPL